jgi:hypothetical protein
MSKWDDLSPEHQRDWEDERDHDLSEYDKTQDLANRTGCFGNALLFGLITYYSCLITALSLILFRWMF